MDRKPESVADASEPQTEQTATTRSMDGLFENLPDHVRVAQRRGVSTGIVGYRSSSK
jgi:hypothetical protein